MEKNLPTLGQNIRALIKKSSYKNLLTFHKAIVAYAENDAISYSSLHNVVNDTKRPEEKTLYQIALVLKMKISDLRQGTTSAVLETGPSEGSYPYNETSVLYNLYNNLPFQPLLIRIKGHGQTSQEKEFAEDAQTFKFFYICKGVVDLVLQQEDSKTDRREFRKGDVFCFDAGVMHHFENTKAQYAEILIVSFKK
jgi:mannose-6-phosphate isomerase-like protein (cupin superfamily)